MLSKTQFYDQGTIHQQAIGGWWHLTVGPHIQSYGSWKLCNPPPSESSPSLASGSFPYLPSHLPCLSIIANIDRPELQSLSQLEDLDSIYDNVGSSNTERREEGSLGRRGGTTRMLISRHRWGYARQEGGMDETDRVFWQYHTKQNDTLSNESETRG